jgi:hypothetical protein
MRPYRAESSDPTSNAQRNLEGRTHYVDADTLRFHKSRVLKTYIPDNGLLFGLIESVAMDMHNTKRGFRYVVFDIFGTVLSRVNLEECFSTREKAQKAMWIYLNGVNAVEVTEKGIANAERVHKAEMEDMRKMLANMAAGLKA